MKYPTSPQAATLLSAIMPGLGQIVQRRWVSAAIHLILFNAFCAWLLVRVIRALADNFRAVASFAEGGPDLPFARLTLMDVLTPLGLATLVYVTGLVDTIRAGRPAAPAQPPALPPNCNMNNEPRSEETDAASQPRRDTA